jgi:cytidylate kinase
MRKLNIAIDGYAGCGKSTLAKDLAKALSYTFVDTGALYRGITLALIQNDIVLDEKFVNQFLQDHQPMLSFRTGDNHLLLNGEDVESFIRNQSNVVHAVSVVAAMPCVRNYLSDLQQAFVALGRVVMEGRDIGTVVMPHAEVKLFITATIEERVKRRHQQLLADGQHISLDDVSRNLLERDQKDAQRAVAPLRKAADAIALDTSFFDRTAQLDVALAIIRPYLEPDKFLRFIR